MPNKTTPGAPSTSLVLRCASIQIAPDPNHPNRVPFSGVVAKLDQPSDGAPHGTMGRKIIIPSSLASELSHGLLLTPINITSAMSGHDLKTVIGTITSVSVEGSDWAVEGVLYGKNFPDEVDLIKAEKDSLGMSIEMSNLIWENPYALGTLKMKMATPTGAAILLKKAAAFQTTSLAANSEVSHMDPMIAQLLASMATMQASQAETSRLLNTISASITDGLAKLATAGTAIQSQLAAAAPAAVTTPAAPAPVPVLSAAVDMNTQIANAMGAALLAQFLGGGTQISAAAVTPATAQPAVVTPVPAAPAAAPDLMASLVGLLTKTHTAPTATVIEAAAAPSRSTLSADAARFVSRHNTDLAAAADGKFSVSDVDTALDKGGYTALQGTGIKMSLRASGLV